MVLRLGLVCDDLKSLQIPAVVFDDLDLVCGAPRLIGGRHCDLACELVHVERLVVLLMRAGAVRRAVREVRE